MSFVSILQWDFFAPGMLFQDESPTIFAKRELGFSQGYPVFFVKASGVTDGRQGGELPPWQAKCKHWAPLADKIFLWFLTGCCLIAFFGVFSLF